MNTTQVCIVRETETRDNTTNRELQGWRAASAGARPVDVTRTRRPRRPAAVRRQLCPGSRRSTGHRGGRSSSRTCRGTATSGLPAMSRAAARRQHLSTTRPLQQHVHDTRHITLACTPPLVEGEILESLSMCIVVMNNGPTRSCTTLRNLREYRGQGNHRCKGRWAETPHHTLSLRKKPA